MTQTEGRVRRVSGPLVEVSGLPDVAMAELVLLGRHRLPGEVVRTAGGVASVQAYEYTGGLTPGDPVSATGRPLSARLGPHLLGGVFDGMLRPLQGAPVWLDPGAERGIARQLFSWNPAARAGDQVGPGELLGTVPGAGGVAFRVLVPPGVSGPVDRIAPSGEYGPDEPVVAIDGAAGAAVGLFSDWPVRRPRPVRARLPGAEPLQTGQRVLDAIFPLARGGTAAVPGGFGTGKTMLLQQIAKWCTADVIVYVGCGERGNEMADVLEQLRELSDPLTGRRLAERTVIIANTSNMPMMARETSVYTGVTVAEFFRDMGYHAVVIADSTSRWAEALREFASRSGELPAEEGYPASLPSALASFYERAGRVQTLGGAEGSVTVIGAVSPPGGDTTEPVTSYTQRFVRTLWNLDRDLAYARHYPAVGWSGSFAKDAEQLGQFYARNGDPDWAVRRARVIEMLAEADRLEDLAELVGAGSLPGRERVVLLAGRLLREAVLQQNALSVNDSHCTPEKTAALVDAVLAVADRCQQIVDSGVTAAEVEDVDFSELVRAAQSAPPNGTEAARAVGGRMLAMLDALR